MYREEEFLGKPSLLTLGLVIAVLIGTVFAASELNAQALELTDYERDIDYTEYLQKHEGAPRPDVEMIIPAEDYSATDMPVKILENFEGNEGKALWTAEEGYVEWEVEVEEAGLYNIAFNYYPAEGRAASIDREILINDERPFQGAGFLVFHRIWTNVEPIRIDNRGNELRPRQGEVPEWRDVYISDSIGYYQDPYLFYFEEGKNTIRINSLGEPMKIDQIRITQYDQPPAYEEYIQKHREQGAEETEGVKIKVQGQDATLRSSSTLFPIHDAGDPTVEPYHPALIRLNSIGGHRWDQPGDWITWEVEVPETGLYQIAIKGKQDIRRGMFSNRRVLINDQVPFQEADAVRFPFSNRYSMHRLMPDENDEPYLFYLEEGTNTITMEVVLGELAELIRITEDSLYDITTMYRRIIMITSANPDPLRDYRLQDRIPQIVEGMGYQSDLIYGLADQLVSVTGQLGGHVAILQDLGRQLERLNNRPDLIPRNLGSLRDNAGALGTWILQTREQPLQIDYLVFASPDEPLPDPSPTMAQTLLHEIRAFAATFYHDYDLVGDVYEPAEADARGQIEPLTVWIGTGRDQAQSLKDMIEDTFTPETGIPVNLELIQPGVILPATLAGEGPDLAVSVDPAMPINFALRGAVINYADFPDFPEVAQRFKHSAIVPFQFREEVYAIPEQQPFPMLFYRKDVLAEMGLDVPETWDDVFTIIAELQKEHMEFGLPFSRIDRVATGAIGQATQGAGSIAAHGGVITLLSFMYQNDVELYQEDGIATNLEAEGAIESFIRWTELYELYNLPLMFNAQNRFRLGEMPLVVTGYTLFNMLTVFAPELRGEWGMTLVPGTRKPDGTIDRSVPPGIAGAGGVPGLTMSPAAGPGVIIMDAAGDKETAWEFVKWWTSSDAQARFGMELESLMGPAGRYPTANVDALQRLPWTADEREILMKQWQWVQGVPEIPGGYLTGRHLDNAFRQVVYNHEPARETLLDYNRVINEEILYKRDEFGIETNFEDIPEKYQTKYWTEEFARDAWGIEEWGVEE